MNARIQELEVEINGLVGSLPEWRKQAGAWTALPGVGKITAVTVLAEIAN